MYSLKFKEEKKGVISLGFNQEINGNINTIIKKLSDLSEKKRIHSNSYHNNIKQKYENDPTFTNDGQNINLSNTPPESLIGNYYDLIISNITLNTLMNNFKNFSLISKKQSKILLSGFYESDVEMVANRLMLYDYNLVNYKTKNKWVSTLFQKS